MPGIVGLITDLPADKAVPELERMVWALSRGPIRNKNVVRGVAWGYDGLSNGKTDAASCK
jgi:hypothetical protein